MVGVPWRTRGGGLFARTEAETSGHTLVIGHGVTGQAVSRVLQNTGMPFRAVDFATDVVDAAQRDGIPIIFGDASRRAVLEHLGTSSARAAVVALGDPLATRRAVSLLRQLNPTLRILVRARRVSEVAELESLGADEAIPAEFEASIELFCRLLSHLSVPRSVIRLEESLLRLDHYQVLRGFSPSPGPRVDQPSALLEDADDECTGVVDRRA